MYLLQLPLLIHVVFVLGSSWCLLGSAPPGSVWKVESPMCCYCPSPPSRQGSHWSLVTVVYFVTYWPFSLLKVGAGLVTSSGFHCMVLSFIPHSWTCGQCVICKCVCDYIKMLDCPWAQVPDQAKKLSASVLPSTPSLSGVCNISWDLRSFQISFPVEMTNRFGLWTTLHVAPLETAPFEWSPLRNVFSDLSISQFLVHLARTLLILDSTTELQC